MRFVSSLQRGVLIRRYKRFLADVRLDTGETVTAHCPNPGSMLGLAESGRTVWVSCSTNPRRKLAHSLELVEDGTLPGGNPCLVGVNTGRANAIVAEALAARRIPELADYTCVEKEVRVGEHTRLDFRLTDAKGGICFLEVKSVTLRRAGPSGRYTSANGAEFPDAVTARGAKHLGVLASLIAQGVRAVLLYVVQREDCASFSLAEDIDPAYAQESVRARGQGLEMLCYACRVTCHGIGLDRPLPVKHPARQRA